MKYEDVEEKVNEQLQKVILDYNFSDLADAKFKLVYRTKKKGRRDFITFAEISATSEMVKFLTSSEIEDGYDYLIVIDKNIYEALDEQDQIRILRHELRHTDVVVNEKTGALSYCTRTHTIEDFFEDVDIESKPDGDLHWKERASTIAESVYEKLEEEKKAERKNKKSRK